MPTYPEKRDALKLRAMQQRLDFARMQVKGAQEQAARYRSFYLEERELRRTSIQAAEKAIRRLRKGRDNARAELAALKVVGTHVTPRMFQCFSDKLIWKESQLTIAPKHPGEALRLWCPECGNDDLIEIPRASSSVGESGVLNEILDVP